MDTIESYWLDKAATKLFDHGKSTGKKPQKIVCREKCIFKIYLAKFFTTTCIISHTPLDIFGATLMCAQKYSWDFLKHFCLFGINLWKDYVLTPSWRRSLSCRNQLIDFPSKSMEWFLYDRDLRHERVKHLDGRFTSDWLRTKNKVL